jgi:hypothetical protein
VAGIGGARGGCGIAASLGDSTAEPKTDGVAWCRSNILSVLLVLRERAASCIHAAACDRKMAQESGDGFDPGRALKLTGFPST